MKKTDFVREVYQENHSHAIHKVGQSTFSQIFSIARSSLYYISQMDLRDQVEQQKLINLHKAHPWYGHRRIGWTLKWSLKKARRLMEKFNIFALMKK